MKLKHKLKQRYKIIDALASKNKKELKKSSWVAYNDVIEFPQPIAFTIKQLKKIIEQVEKAKLKGDNILVGLMMQMPIPKDLQDQGIEWGSDFKFKSVKKKYGDVK